MKEQSQELCAPPVQPDIDLRGLRGFTTLLAAMAWAMKVNRTVILEVEFDRPHKLPDHHNKFGEAWWNDGNVARWKRAYSADREGDAA